MQTRLAEFIKDTPECREADVIVHECVRAASESDAPVFPLLLALHERLKAAFDPHRVFNPRRLYETL